jgi:hypothetical protein
MFSVGNCQAREEDWVVFERQNSDLWKAEEAFLVYSSWLLARRCNPSSSV